MALSDEVQSRYSSQLLINASNPQLSTATSIDTARLTLACTDVQAAFEVMCGVAYDNTVATHVAYAVEGVFQRLLVLTGQASIDTWKDWKATLKDELALVTGRDRIEPTTDSLLSPTEDTMGDLPQSDRKNFRGLIPRNANPPTTD